MKKIFEVVKIVVKELFGVFVIILLCFASLGLSGFLIIKVLPEIIRILGTILIALGVIMLIFVLVIRIAFVIHKASTVYSFAKKNNTSVDEAWETIDPIEVFLDT